MNGVEREAERLTPEASPAAIETNTILARLNQLGYFRFRQKSLKIGIHRGNDRVYRPV